MGELMRDASFSLAAAKYAAGEFAPTVRESASVASVKVRMATENAMGVRLPVFEKTQDNVAGRSTCGCCCFFFLSFNILSLFATQIRRN
jgi:vacuolar-type H+-ATPase subunit D/Vma8